MDNTDNTDAEIHLDGSATKFEVGEKGCGDDYGDVEFVISGTGEGEGANAVKKQRKQRNRKKQKCGELATIAELDHDASEEETSPSKSVSSGAATVAAHPVMRFLRQKLHAIVDLDRKIYRMDRLYEHVSTFSFFDDDDAEELAQQREKCRECVGVFVKEVRVAAGQPGCDWVAMNRVLKKREHTLNEAQLNGILCDTDPVFPILVQKQKQMTDVLRGMEEVLRTC